MTNVRQPEISSESREKHSLATILPNTSMTQVPSKYINSKVQTIRTKQTHLAGFKVSPQIVFKVLTKEKKEMRPALLIKFSCTLSNYHKRKTSSSELNKSFAHTWILKAWYASQRTWWKKRKFLILNNVVIILWLYSELAIFFWVARHVIPVVHDVICVAHYGGYVLLSRTLIWNLKQVKLQSSLNWLFYFFKLFFIYDNYGNINNQLFLLLECSMVGYCYPVDKSPSSG